MTDVAATPGLSVSDMFKTGFDSIEAKGTSLQAEMKKLSTSGEVSPEDMLKVQYQMGQYNALMESISSLTKSLTDMAKSLAQRQG